MKVFLNPGHDRTYDSGACHWSGTREADIAWLIGCKVQEYLEAAGVETMIMQSDNLCGWDCDREDRPKAVCKTSDNWEADLFVSIHCNAFNQEAKGTEVEYISAAGAKAAQCIQDQIVDALGTVDRGIKVRRDLMVLKHTDAVAVLVECAFIDNDEDHEKLVNRTDEFAAVIARGITDYELTL
ncbi:putative N-acetylmuramoyl-L-alanine amidase (plasmid) [Selenomonas ruminantium subsp. lactilytica TAM6421]|uniref:Putative N-acetylmuramoyl-L-alanine amidase n=1 Tax=Selenomonas ruminantium subsp. lactilytica (strain NBRC 103574 / TAM6421) TaxID=927704 RepID=I0GWT1_SELRL|nr:N-acetylmuramoyl-L-alanine amidase [Selenomonas ruminantium]BAL85218.1 putative N-acetylmuramoyl-L-alanine amidase [Selenomonas ruminantium subsp. lactilytica TAM6421]